MLLTMVATTSEMWGQTKDNVTVSYGWEDADDATAWTITDAITKTSGQGNTGTYAGKINTNHTYVQFNEKVNVTSFSFAFKRTSNNSNYNVYIETSTDGSNWTAAETYTMSSFYNGSYLTKTKTFDGNTAYYVRFHCYNTTAVRYVDDVSITYTTGGGSDPSISADDVNIAYNATGGSINYTLTNATGNVEAAITSGDWLTLGTVTASEVPFTCSANTGAERTATVTLSFEGAADKVVTVTQAAVPVIYTTIPEIFAAATSTETAVHVTFNNWVVSGVSTTGKNVYVTDGTNGLIIYYTTDMSTTFSAGNVLNGENVSCTLKLYNGAAELLNVDAADLTITTGGTVTPASIAMADLTGVNTGTLLHYENLTCTSNNNKYFLTDGTTSIQLYNSLYAFTNPTVGNTYNITGVYAQYNTTKEIMPRSAADIEEVLPTEPSITVANATVNVEAEGGEGTLTVTYENITDVAADVWFCNAAGTATATYDWIDAEIDNQTNNVEYLVEPNDGEARTAYFKVWAYDDNLEEVYSNIVTVTQAEYIAPTYAELPFSFNGGRADIEGTDGLSQEGLGSDYSSAPKLKFDSTGDWLLLQFSESPGTLTFDIKGNGFSGGTFKVQTSTDGTTYTDLETYDALGDTQTKEFTNLDENVRYIKWIYTEKSSGNVGLGNIILAKVDHTPSITINPGPYNLNANGGDAELPVTYTNMPNDPQAEVIFYESNGETPLGENPTWITATINNAGNVDGHIDANTGAARSAYFKVKGIDANDNAVYSELVTINQAAYVLSIEFETASIDLAAGGESDRKLSFEYSGLGNDPEFSVNRYEYDGTTPATYDWLTTEITDGNKVSITVTANTGAARTAYFKVYGENGNVNTESNLVTVNQGAAGQTVSYTLITNINDLTPGYHYLIASEATLDELDIMDEQKSNNRGVKSVDVNNGTITLTNDYYDFVISGYENHWTIYDESYNQGNGGFLYAASNGSNYLKTRAANSDRNSEWSIAIDNEGVATLVAQGNYTRNTMQYNSSSSIFACYSSASQSAVYLYKKTTDTPVYYSPTEITVNNPNTSTDPITVQNNEILELTGTVTATDPANLIIEDGGQLIHNGNVNATLKKNVAASPTWGSRGVSGWYTIASPVADMAVSCATTGDYDFFAFNEENTKWLNQKVGANNITNFEQGVGYLYANADATVIDYLGTLIGTETEVTKPLSYACENASYQGINLMGNPFSRNLVAGDIEIAGTPLTTYYTVEGGNELTAKTLASTPIKPGQGFMVQATASSQNLVFNPTSKDRSAAKVGYISIVAGNSEFTDNAFVQVGGGNTLHKMTLSDNSSIVYVMNNGNDYAAATIDALEGSMPVCFKANALGSYTITIEAIDINADYLHLIDNFTGEDINLLLEPSYSFIASNGDRAERFTLVFRSNGSEGTTNDIFAFQNGSDIVVNGEGELQVFDVTGRMVATQHVNGVQTVNVPSQGVFIFKLNEKTQKIVVR